MDERYQKFLDKNKENLEKIDKHIEEHGENISRMCISNEFYWYLKELDLLETAIDDELIGKYKGVTVKGDVWFPSKQVMFLYKDSAFTIEIPCVCGYYSDEEHGSRLR